MSLGSQSHSCPTSFTLEPVVGGRHLFSCSFILLVFLRFKPPNLVVASPGLQSNCVTSIPKVRRKGSYKGKMKLGVDTDPIPMDSCTIPGILLCLSCFLSAKGLKLEQVKCCEKIVSKLESKLCLSEMFNLLPQFRGGNIAINENEIDLQDLHDLVEECGVQWTR